MAKTYSPTSNRFHKPTNPLTQNLTHCQNSALVNTLLASGGALGLGKVLYDSLGRKRRAQQSPLSYLLAASEEGLA